VVTYDPCTSTSSPQRAFLPRPPAQSAPRSTSSPKAPPSRSTPAQRRPAQKRLLPKHLQPPSTSDPERPRPERSDGAPPRPGAPPDPGGQTRAPQTRARSRPGALRPTPERLQYRGRLQTPERHLHRLEVLSHSFFLLNLHNFMILNSSIFYYTFTHTYLI
jgi:hypothetical protein